MRPQHAPRLHTVHAEQAPDLRCGSQGPAVLCEDTEHDNHLGDITYWAAPMFRSSMSRLPGTASPISATTTSCAPRRRRTWSGDDCSRGFAPTETLRQYARRAGVLALALLGFQLHAFAADGGSAATWKA